MKENKLSTLNIAVMYIGAIMGAGFASGRETWQFFGVFGKGGIAGVIVFAVLFMAIGHIIRYNAKVLQTNNMGKIIVPGGNPKMEAFVETFMAIILATVMIIMSAAGGALLHQQFGFDYYVGGLLIVFLTVITVLGDFERVSRVFRYIMPILCIAMVATCIIVLSSGLKELDSTVVITPSPAAPNWIIASLLYVCYNMMALVSIVATSTINAKDDKTATNGATMGAVFLGILAMLILLTILVDPGFSQAMDMPILGYANRVSRIMSNIYTIILFCAIYSASTSNYYGFTTRIKDGPKKKWIIIATAIVGFILGLFGFKNFVSFISPIIGYVGIVVVIILVCNFINLRKKEKNNGES
ncbi:MAG: hypothetical protein IKU67_02610 [Firmicutes bacterium]|nr:hypothetical protein [Bacillota bacterium]